MRRNSTLTTAVLGVVLFMYLMHVLAQADTETGTSWSTAEHRTRDRFVESQTGYMQGAAGVGSFLLHLATASAGSPVKIVLPDRPFYRTF